MKLISGFVGMYSNKKILFYSHKIIFVVVLWSYRIILYKSFGGAVPPPPEMDPMNPSYACLT